MVFLEKDVWFKEIVLEFFKDECVFSAGSSENL
jgi:hypothetical protein